MRDNGQSAFVQSGRPFVPQHGEAYFKLLPACCRECRFTRPPSIPQRGGHSHFPQLGESTTVEQRFNIARQGIVIGETHQGAPGSVEVMQASTHLKNRHKVWSGFDDLHEPRQRFVAALPQLDDPVAQGRYQARQHDADRPNGAGYARAVRLGGYSDLPRRTRHGKLLNGDVLAWHLR